jgi:pimeloyl-ACP methyl ester carboxylesterase
MTTEVKSGYAPVNGLKLYYEIHGAGGTPLVLLHGAYSAIGTSFADMLPTLAHGRQVIGVELQGHGRTADIDRPLTVSGMASDVAALLRHLGIAQADLFGYSMGAGVALQVAIDTPELVRKLVLVSVNTKVAGIHPGLMEGWDQMSPEMLHGTPWHDEYMSIAPNPENFATLVEKMKVMDANIADTPDEVIRAIKAPTLLVIGDSDIVQPEHAVEIFRLLGGGVVGDLVGLPNSQLAILPGTTHVTAIYRADLLLIIVPAFLDAPMPEAKGE